MKCSPLTSVLIYLFIIVQACTADRDNSVSLFVAASLAPSLEMAVGNDTVHECKINTASSGILAKQITSGAPCDIYFSANKKWMQFLCEKGIVDSLEVSIIAVNKLVFAIPANDSTDLSATTSWDEYLTMTKKVAIGNPDYVPVGEYAAQALNKLELYAANEIKFNKTKDAPSALKLVEMGEVDAGFLYKTDALLSKKVYILSEIADSLYSPVNYYMAPVTAKGSAFISGTNFREQLNTALINNGFQVK